MIHFTADPHFSHTNVLRYCRRPFKDVQEMDNELIKRWNSVVKPEDTVYILGDFSLKGSEDVDWYRRILKKLPGEKHLILGNHDTLKPFTYIDVGFASVHTHLHLNDMMTPEHEMWDEIILAHDPSVSVMDRSKLYLVGHVHDLFKICKNAVNVGVDVWDYTPVSLKQIEELVEDSTWKDL